jgi:hypothetical protein
VAQICDSGKLAERALLGKPTRRKTNIQSIFWQHILSKASILSVEGLVDGGFGASIADRIYESSRPRFYFGGHAANAVARAGGNSGGGQAGG